MSAQSMIEAVCRQEEGIHEYMPETSATLLDQNMDPAQ
jgi:hypothetical protein